MDPARQEPGPDPGHVKLPRQGSNITDALMRDTSNRARMCVNIAASTVGIFSMVHLVNKGNNAAPGLVGLPLQGMLGWSMRPLMWLAGMPWAESAAAGELMGVKTILNRVVPYLQFAQSGGSGLLPRSSLIRVRHVRLRRFGQPGQSGGLARQRAAGAGRKDFPSPAGAPG